jgi:hypothetical protein
MKGKIMDKKILLGGAAALLMAGSMYATPASASISLELGGEASLTATMNDNCFTAQAADSLNTALADTDIGDGVANAEADDATVSEHTDADGAVAGIVTYAADPCSGNDEDNPVLGFGKEISISAGGTLANGLEVSFSDTLDLADVDGEEGAFELSLGGAFGTLTFKDGADSAVDAAMVGDTSGADVTGALDLGGHILATSGTDGTGILYQAPTMGALDLYVGYAPNSGDTGDDTAEYLDTFSIGMTFSSGDLTVGGGIESATSENNDCDLAATLVLADAAITAAALFDDVYGTEHCGDQDLIAVGAEYAMGDMTFSAAYSELDTGEADQTSVSFGVATTLSDIDVAVDYTTSENDFGPVSDEQNVVHIGLSTALGDGVDLSLDVSSNDIAIASEANGGGHGGEFTTTFAEMKLAVGF